MRSKIPITLIMSYVACIVVLCIVVCMYDVSLYCVSLYCTYVWYRVSVERVAFQKKLTKNLAAAASNFYILQNISMNDQKIKR